MPDSTLLLYMFIGLSVLFLPTILYYKTFSLASEAPPSAEKIPFFSPLFAACSVPLVSSVVTKWVLPLFHFGALANFAVAQLLGLFAAFIVLMGLVRIHSKAVQTKIFGTKSAWKAILRGIYYCLLIYPIVMLTMQGIHLVVDQIYPDFQEEQIAIQLFKRLQSKPYLFWSYAVAACTLIPLLEELLFRGFFQNWLVDRLGRRAGIILAALLFAGAHFSSSQGAANIELMFGLVTMGLLLGVVYVKEQSLLASVAMHGTFNGLTVLLFIFS